MKEIDVTALGEVLIDFTSAGLSVAGQVMYERNAGGAPANVAAGVARLGGRSAFIGKTGNDIFGAYLRETLASYGVETRGMLADSVYPTTLAFVTLAQDGERSFSFYRNPGADTMLASAELDVSLLENTRFLHIGSLSMTNEPARSATLGALKIAKNAGVYISYDPNWRSRLWNDREEGIDIMKSLFPFADIVKVSEEELELLTGTEDYSRGSSMILIKGAKLVLVTLGSEGAFYKTALYEGIVKAPAVSALDTTGAGDSFVAGILYRLSRSSADEDIFAKNKAELEDDLSFANSAAALCVTKRGAIPAMPLLEDVLKFQKNNYSKEV